MVRSLLSPTPSTSRVGSPLAVGGAAGPAGGSAGGPAAPPSLRTGRLIHSSTVRKRRRSAEDDDEGRPHTDDPSSGCTDRSQDGSGARAGGVADGSPTKRLKSEEARSAVSTPVGHSPKIDFGSVSSVGSSVSTVFSTMFSPVYNLLARASSAAGMIANGATGNIAEAAAAADAAAADDVDEEDEWDDYDFDPWDFIKSLPPLEEVDGGKWLGRPPALPPRKPSQRKRLTLVLDLDETLVHCDVNKMDKYDYLFPVALERRTYMVYARVRPHMIEFLERVSKQFEVVLFTASQQVYADKLLDLFDADRKLIPHRLFRPDCVEVEGNYVKDLHILGRDLATTIIVDNSLQAFAYQVSNGIHIKTWHNDPKDTELMKLLPFLEQLAQDRVADVRPVLEKRFGLVARLES